MIEIIQSKHWIEWLINIAKFAFAFVPVLFILLLIPLERRGAGFIQDRQGPNRSYFRLPYFGKIRLFGWVHNASDGLKLFFKENYAPHGVNKLLFLLAPAIPFAVVLIAPAVIRSEEHTSELQSRPHLVCRLLLEKKKKTQATQYQQSNT